MHKNFRTYQLALEFYKKTELIKLKGNIGNQFKRAALSILLNLSEGVVKSSRKERRKFYGISFASLREVQSLLDITGNNELLKASDKLAAHLYCLIRNT